MKKSSLALLTLLASASLASAQLVYESFDYSSGNLNGKNGGSGSIGWSGAWTSTDVTDISFGTGARPFEVANSTVTTNGNYFQQVEGPGTTSTRTFASGIDNSDVGGDSVWISFLASTTGRPIGFALSFRDSTDTELVGITRGDTDAWRLRTNDVGNTSFGNSSRATDGDMDLIVLQLDYTGNVSGWINPDLTQSTITPTGSTFSLAGGNSLAWTSGTLDDLSLDVNNKTGVTTYWDEIRVGDSFAAVVAIPEPSTFALFAGTLGLGLVMLRRRRSS